MTNKSSDIEDLSRKLNILIGKQDVLSKELEEIRSALANLRKEEISGEGKIKSREGEEAIPEVIGKKEAAGDIEKVEISAEIKPSITKSAKQPHKPISLKLPGSIQSNLEDFIGTNLINKIGIILRQHCAGGIPLIL